MQFSTKNVFQEEICTSFLLPSNYARLGSHVVRENWNKSVSRGILFDKEYKNNLNHGRNSTRKLDKMG